MVANPRFPGSIGPTMKNIGQNLVFLSKKKNTNIKILPGFGLLKWEMTILTNKFFKPLRRFPCPNPGGVLKFGFGRDVPPRNLKIDPYKYQFFKKK